MEALGIFQEVHHLFDFFLGFVTTGHVCESDLVVVFVQHARFTLAKAKRPAFTTALHLTHEVHPHTDQQQHRPPADQQSHEKRAFFARSDVKLHTVGNEIADQATVEISGGCANLALIIGDRADFCTALTFLDGGSLDALCANFLKEVRIAHVTRTNTRTSFKLFEYREHHQSNDQPDSDF